jgi:hypothetical protein
MVSGVLILREILPIALKLIKEKNDDKAWYEGFLE